MQMQPSRPHLTLPGRKYPLTPTCALRRSHLSVGYEPLAVYLAIPAGTSTLDLDRAAGKDPLAHHCTGKYSLSLPKRIESIAVPRVQRSLS